MGGGEGEARGGCASVHPSNGAYIIIFDPDGIILLTVIAIDNVDIGVIVIT